MVYALLLNGKYFLAFENYANALRERDEAISRGYEATLVAHKHMGELMGAYRNG
jgi:hypothetical protein